MRTRSALVAVLLLTGCKGEQSFDERYTQTQKAIRQKADEIDADMAERERQASEAAALPTAAPSDQAASLMKAAK